MNRVLCVALALAIGPAAADAAAQAAAPPVEIGFDVSSVLSTDRGSVAPGPRLVINFDGRNALEATASLEPLSSYHLGAQRRTDLYLVAFKRVVHASGPVRAFATLGGGLARTRIVVPESTWPGSPGIVSPASSRQESLPAAAVGTGIDIRAGRYVAVTLESSFVVADRLGGRLSAGLTVPLGAYPRHRRLPASVPWTGLSDGDHAWVTAHDDRMTGGEVVGRSETRLELRTPQGIASFAPEDVRAIDTTDPIRNGTILGAKIGGLGALVPSTLATYLVCLEEDCGVSEILGLNALFVGLGAGVGAATGAIVDSLRDGRVPLYRRDGVTGVTVGPFVNRNGAGVGAAFRW